MSETSHAPDKRLVRASFNRAANSYDEAAVLQREVGSRLLERLELMRIAPQRILDIGSGTGWCSAALLKRYPKATLVSLDLAEAMVQATRRRIPRLSRWRGRHHALCADAEQLPLADGSVDLIVSNLTFQWCKRERQLFDEIRRCLRPGGLLLFSSFGPDTLKELKAAWAQVDQGIHVNAFTDMHDLGDAMLGAQLADPVTDMEMITLTYRELRPLLDDLKAIGAHNVNAGRGRGLLGKQKWQALQQAYEAFRRDERLPATYEVIYGHAWAGEGSVQQRRQDDGSTHISLEQFKVGLHER